MVQWTRASFSRGKRDSVRTEWEIEDEWVCLGVCVKFEGREGEGEVGGGSVFKQLIETDQIR